MATLVNGNNRVVVKNSGVPGEYVCKLWVDGVYQRDADYFTDDEYDAFYTANAMVSRVLKPAVIPAPEPDEPVLIDADDSEEDIQCYWITTPRGFQPEPTMDGICSWFYDHENESGLSDDY